MAGVDGLWMLGVCDGHGANGHLVSDYVKKTLPVITAKLIHEAIGHISRKSSQNFLKNSSGKPKNPKSKEGGGNILPPLVKMQKNKSSYLQTDVIEFETKGNALLRTLIDDSEFKDCEGITAKFHQWFESDPLERE